LKNEVIKFFPDLVVLFFLPGNDIEDVSRKTAPDLIRPFYHISKSGKLTLDTNFVEMREYKIKCLINLFKQHSILISLICERYNSYKLKKQESIKSTSNAKKGEVLSEKIEGSLSLCTDKPYPRYLRNYKLNKLLIRAISDYCKNRGIRFMLVTIDIAAYVPEIEKKYKTIDPTFDAYFFEDDLKSFANNINIEYIGLQRIFRRYFENTGSYLHWEQYKGHWNYEGHKVVSNALIHKLSTILCLIN